MAAHAAFVVNSFLTLSFLASVAVNYSTFFSVELLHLACTPDHTTVRPAAFVGGAGDDDGAARLALFGDAVDCDDVRPRARARIRSASC